MAARKKILVFDSGLGGLTVYREVAAARPDAEFIYVADDAGFPYGRIEEQALAGAFGERYLEYMLRTARLGAPCVTAPH